MAINDPITPPTHVAEWATDGGADKTIPASPSLGHVVGEKTDFNASTNYILNNLAAWSKFNYELNAADIAYANVDQELTETFGASALTATHMTYDPLADMWYFATYRSGNAELYSSPTGLDGTWSVAVVRTCTADHLMTPLRSNGTYVGIALDDGFHLSTSNSISDIPVSPTSTFNNIDEVTDLVYDAVSGQWFAVGEDTGTGFGWIEKSSDGTTWTNAIGGGVSNRIVSISITPAGGGCVTTDLSTENYYASDADGTWSSTITDPAAYLIQTAWSATLELFIATTVSEDLYFSETGQHWENTGLDVYAMFVTPELTLAYEKSTGECLAFVSPAYSRTSFTMARLGKWSMLPSNYWDSDTTWEGGQGKLIFTHGSFDELVVSVYGPGV